MKPKIRIISALLMLILLGSFVLYGLGLNHDCIGDGCIYCIALQIWRTVYDTAAVVFTASVLLLLSVHLRKIKYEGQYDRTPVELFVEMQN